MGGRIVVGVDASESSRRAVQYALEEARRRGASVEIVHAYQLPIYWGPPEYGGSIPGPTREEAELQAHEVIHRSMGVAPTDVPIEYMAVHGHPATTLLRLAQGADLLVVGSRGRGGLRGLLLGSTSHHVITHSPCPVVVIGHQTLPSVRAA